MSQHPPWIKRTGEADTVRCPCPRCADLRQSNAVLAVRRYHDIGAEFLGYEVETRREYDLKCKACGHVHHLIVEGGK